VTVFAIRDPERQTFFLEYDRDADPDILILKQAKVEHAKLQ